MVIASLLSLAACAQAVPRAAPDSPYRETLAAGYRRLAMYETRRGRPAVASYFGDKEQAALAGAPTLPDRPRLDVLPLQAGQQLNDAYGRLSQALDGGLVTRQPAIAARLQVSYDCWLATQDRHFLLQPLHCQRDFETDLQRLDATATASQPLTLIAAVPVYQVPASDAEGTLDLIAQDYRRFHPSTILVTADAATAPTIAAALQKHGVAADAIQIATARRTRHVEPATVEFRS